MSEQDKNYYVYILIDPRSNTPFYVGKGQQDRMYSHEVEARSKYWYNELKCQWIVDIWSSGFQVKYEQVFCEDERSAFLLERELIATVGRLISNDGPLTNLHPGGGGYGRSGKVVYQYSPTGLLLEIFSSVSEAAAKTNIDESTISACCRDQQRSSGGFLWSYSNESVVPYVRRSEKRKPVYQYELSGEFVSEYPSATDACLSLNKSVISSTKISAVCRNKLPSFAGYLWSYNKVEKLAAKRPQKRPVLQFDVQTKEVINEYESITHAVKKTGIKTISACCNGKYSQAGGYGWKFKQTESSE